MSRAGDRIGARGGRPGRGPEFRLARRFPTFPNSLAALVASEPVPFQLQRTPTAPAAANDPTEFVRRHLRGLWRYLRLHGADAHTADDLTQEAFVVALQKGALWLPEAAAATFLRRTARFVHLRHLRDHRAAVELADAVDALWQRDCAGDDGDGLVAALRRCVEQLDGRARLAVTRCYGLGADAPGTHHAVAAELGMLPNGLKTLLQRTRQLLRACLERHQSGDQR